MGMDNPEKEGKRVYKASRSHEIPFNIPSSYKISPEILEKVKKVTDEDVSDTVALLKVFSDPMRVRILKALQIADLCVCVLVELMNCEYSKLSYHLKVLKEAELIDCTKEGNFLIYHLTEFGEKKVTSF
jgi:DNA-binding transcriptional ArsR family regulator